jgi:hypothetical protein
VIDPFKWLVVENDVGSFDGSLENPPKGCDSDSNYDPKACEWPSIRSIKASARIYSSGDSTEWNSVNSLEIDRVGKYMVTVMAEGYRLCGGYFEVTGSQTTNTTVTPVCQQFPLPLGTIRVFVFEDNAPCNGQYDPGETPLRDFGIGVNDIEGPIATGTFRWLTPNAFCILPSCSWTLE